MRQEPDYLGVLFEHDLCLGLPVRITGWNVEGLFILKRRPAAAFRNRCFGFSFASVKAIRVWSVVAVPFAT